MRKYIIPLLLLALCSASCDRDSKEPSREEIDRLLEGAPQIFVKNQQGLTLEGIEDFHLGQSKDDALARLDDYCTKTFDYETGDLSENAWFRGCRLQNHAPLTYLRIGFWPKNDDRVSTLEIKRESLRPRVVRYRFQRSVETVDTAIERPGIVQMTTPRYRLFADWDEGADGPTHITVGLQPDTVEE